MMMRFFISRQQIIPVLKEILHRKINVNFHTPNGLHARFITPAVAGLLKSTGFVKPRISLESADPEKQTATGSKITNEEFQGAASYLKEAGYTPGGYIAYIMLGMPDQNLDDVRKSIDFANK